MGKIIVSVCQFTPGGYPSQVRMRGYPGQVKTGGGGGYPARSGEGVPQPVQGGRYPGYGWGPPHPGQHEVPPSRDGVSPILNWLGYPPPGIGQQMEHLIHGRQYASCIHAGTVHLSALVLVVNNI